MKPPINCFYVKCWHDTHILTKKGKEGLQHILDISPHMESTLVMAFFQLNSTTVQLIVELSDKKHMVLILYHGLASCKVMSQRTWGFGKTTSSNLVIVSR